MSDPDEIRLVLSVRAWPELRHAYQNWEIGRVRGLLTARMLMKAAIRFEVVALPSNAPLPDGLDITDEQFRQFLVFGIVVYGGEKSVRVFADGVKNLPDAAIGADLAVNAANDAFWSHWCPAEAGDGLVGDRAAALRTVHADPALLTAAGLPGPNQANIVFVDTGLPSSLLPKQGFKGWCVLEDPDPAFKGGKTRCPGAPLSPHGEMVARNAYAIASTPNAPNRLRLLDCPVIPDGITNLRIFLSSVTAALFQVLAVVAFSRISDPAAGWVICNAWSVFNPTLESSELPYSNNPNHPIAKALRLLNTIGADVVFAAGNCGEFCPDPRCSPSAIGPSRSINGANALKQVLTVGAVRTDRLWLGYSGQGPGVAGMENNKPDICAPSQFESDDLPGRNTGTSAACGLAAGAVALFRTKWVHSNLSPDQLADEIRHSAAQPYGPQVWQDRTGYGILDLAATALNLAVS